MSIDRPFFSVILPVYNGQEYVRASVESVLSQEFSDFEFIIWDDASSDASVSIISEYRDARIRFFRNEQNCSLFPTLNKALLQARGAFVKLWCQDDVMETFCLKEFAEFFHAHPHVPMVYCDVHVIGPRGDTIAPLKDDATPEIIDPWLSTQLLFYYGSIPGNIANVALSRKIFDEVGFFNEKLLLSGDFEKWIQISEKHALGKISKPLVRLRSHRNQLSKAFQSGLIFMQEEYLLCEILRKRLAPGLTRFALEYTWKQKYVQHMHYLIRCFLRGDFATVACVYRHIQRETSFVPLLLWWLISANGRLFSVQPRFVNTP
ncbi:MAG TPA: glycosyltransferase [Candidatus Omnitrophota bacterium]|nr:glycosyltransferase [Candidatus Omnitrophota bacterium]